MARRTTPDPAVATNLQRLMAASLDLQSQPALARRSGVSQTTIGRVLRDEVAASGDNLRAIARALGVTLDALYAPAAIVAPLHRRDVAGGARERYVFPPEYDALPAELKAQIAGYIARVIDEHRRLPKGGVSGNGAG